MTCNIDCTAETLKALAHPLRLKILCNLNNGEMSVRELVEKIGSTQSNVSQHLNQMRRSGILHSRRKANRVYYRIGDNEPMSVVTMMRKIYCDARP